MSPYTVICTVYADVFQSLKTIYENAFPDINVVNEIKNVIKRLKNFNLPLNKY